MIEATKKKNFFTFFLAKKFEKDYDNDFRIVIEEFFRAKALT